MRKETQPGQLTEQECYQVKGEQTMLRIDPEREAIPLDKATIRHADSDDDERDDGNNDSDDHDTT